MKKQIYYVNNVSKFILNKNRLTIFLLFSMIYIFTSSILFANTILSNNNTSETSPKTKKIQDNITIIDSLINNTTINSLNVLKKQNLKLNEISVVSNLLLMSDNIELSVLKNIDILKSENNANIVINPPKSKVEFTDILKYNINNFEINYNNIDNGNLIEREIIFSSNVIFTNKTNNLILNNESYIYKDTINESDILSIENQNFPISIGRKKQEESTFFDDILEPIIITGTIAVTVILLFTIRSN